MLKPTASQTRAAMSCLLLGIVFGLFALVGILHSLGLLR